MASINEELSFSETSQIEREALERTCQELITGFVKMKFEGFPANNSEMHVLSNTKGPVLSTDNKKSKKNHDSTPSQSDGYHHESSIESSVDGPETTHTTISTLSELAEKVTVSSVLSDVVPQTLPMDMRSDLSSVKEKDVKKMYNVKESVQKMKEGKLSQAELVVLHWRSYRNILVYELSDFQELQMRFLRFFTAVFADVIELCYPTPEARQGLEGHLFQEFQAHHASTTLHKCMN